MFLFLFRVRAKSESAVPMICRVFEHTMSLFREPGWLGGACVADLEDPREVLIYEMWGSEPALQAWLSSDARVEAHRRLAPYVEGPPAESTYQEVA